MIIKDDMVILHEFSLLYIWNEILTRLKKFATLLPNNWIAETRRRLLREGLADSRGIIIPALKIGLVDGTAPHVIEPKAPGAIEEYVKEVQ